MVTCLISLLRIWSWNDTKVYILSWFPWKPYLISDQNGQNQYPYLYSLHRGVPPGNFYSKTRRVSRTCELYCIPMTLLNILRARSYIPLKPQDTQTLRTSSLWSCPQLGHEIHLLEHKHFGESSVQQPSQVCHFKNAFSNNNTTGLMKRRETFFTGFKYF